MNRINRELGIIDERWYECVECGVTYSDYELDYGLICEHCGLGLVEVGCDEHIHRGYEELGIHNIDMILEDRRGRVGTRY